MHNCIHSRRYGPDRWCAFAKEEILCIMESGQPCPNKKVQYERGPKVGAEIVIVDIDGTLTKVGDRAECLARNPPDWDEFYARCGEDEPVKPIIRIVQKFSWDYNIVLCSGRRESCRDHTEKWLDKYDIHYTKMLLRKDGDFRHDTVIKPELLKEAGIELDGIAFVMEDRNAMVKKWRSMGLVCLQVAEGDF